jgi:hypothetical protein
MTARRFAIAGSPPVLDGELGPDEVAFVDAADRDASSWWGDVRVDDPDAARLAATDVVHAAQRAAAVAGVADVTVVGDGILAALLRGMVAANVGSGSAPVAVIDAAGTQRSIALALSMVAPGGLVVLAAEPEQPCLDVRTYGDIHVRGVRVVGVPAADAPSGPVDDADVDWVLSRLVDTALGAPLVDGAWYRVSAGAVTDDRRLDNRV